MNPSHTFEPRKHQGLTSKSVAWKPNDRGSKDVDDLPSNLSVDEWGEINRYGQILAQEEEKKKVEQRLSKQRKVREVLDSQIREQQLFNQKRLELEKQQDQQQISLSKSQLQKEESEKLARKQKAFEAKNQRDQMLREAQALKQVQQSRAMQEEKELLSKLKGDLEREQESLKSRRARAKQAAK